MKFKIAVVQFEIEQFNPETNLQKAQNFIKKASLDKSDIIVFPEDFVTWPIVGKFEFADSKSKYVKFFQDLAIKYKIDIVTWSIIEKNNLGYFNCSYFIDSNWKIKGKYKKINLWHDEKNYLNPWNEICVFNSKYWKIWLIICWDLMFPEIFRKMLNKWVNIVICPSYWCMWDNWKFWKKYNKLSELILVDSLCISRSFENEVIIVYCNAAWNFKFWNYTDKLIWHSQICLPFIWSIKKIENNQENYFVQEIDTKILKDTEKVYKIRKDTKNRVLY